MLLITQFTLFVSLRKQTYLITYQAMYLCILIYWFVSYWGGPPPQFSGGFLGDMAPRPSPAPATASRPPRERRRSVVVCWVYGICVYVLIYRYISIEREREGEIGPYNIYVYICIYIHLSTYTHTLLKQRYIDPLPPVVQTGSPIRRLNNLTREGPYEHGGVVIASLGIIDNFPSAESYVHQLPDLFVAVGCIMEGLRLFACVCR